jgi:hypothetical protein
MSAILDTIPELEEQVISDLTAEGVRSDFAAMDSLLNRFCD